MKPDYIQGRWRCAGNCKDLIAMNIVYCNDGSFKCLLCGQVAHYNVDSVITQEQFRKRFGHVGVTK